MEIWKVEIGSREESTTMVAMTRELALRAAVEHEYRQFTAIPPEDEHYVAKGAWRRREEDPEGVLRDWFGPSNAHHPDDHENETWGDEQIRFVHIIQLDLIEKPEDI